MNSHYQQSKPFQSVQSDTVITPDQIYQTLIRQTPNLYPLCKFKTKGTTKPLFPDAIKYPEFFNDNLVSPGRVIKKLQGPDSLVKGFYYQLMKLVFEIEIEDRDYIEVLRNVIFSPQFMLQENPSSPSSGKNYSDLQYKKIVAEFMQILMHQSIPNFELTIMSFPIVDQAMMRIMQNLLKFKNSVEFPINSSMSSFEILTLLAQLFQITVHQYGNCFKFQQSDTFFYEHSKNEYYIAFLNEMAEMSDFSESSKRRDSSSYEPVSSKKIVRLDQRQNDDEYSAKKAIRTHDYLHSQFDIQTPAKYQVRQCSSNPPQAKLESDTKNYKNHRNTIGSHQLKINQQPTLQIPHIKHKQDQEKPQKMIPSENSRQRTESIINKLHQLVNQTQQSQLPSYPKFDHEYNHTKKVQIPSVPLAKFIAQPNKALSESEMIKKHQPQPKISIKQPIKYEYKAKGYGKKVTFEETSTFLAKPTQSNQFIGYLEIGIGSSKGSINMMPSSNSIYSNKQLSKPIESNMNIQTQTKQATLNKTKQIQQLGLLGNGKPSTFNHDGFQQKYKGFGPHSQPTIPENSNFNKFIQKIHLVSNLKGSVQTNMTQIKTQSKQDIFYSPKPLVSKPNFIEQTNIYKSPLKNQQTLGTLYRQFSDTKVLDILPEQMQNNIRKMRRKYKGVHSKDFFGIRRF